MVKVLLTGAGLLRICPVLRSDRADKIADDMYNILPGFAMYTKEVLPDFVAQVAHESGQFRLKEENLNYRSADRIKKIWPARFTLATAAPFVRNPIGLANRAYGGRMGNFLPNDGWDMRGSGYIECTGRSIATEMADFFGIDDPAEMMKLCREEDYWAMSSSAWLFAVNKKLIPLAVADQIVMISRRINGGLIGIEDRKLFFERAKKVIL